MHPPGKQFRVELELKRFQVGEVHKQFDITRHRVFQLINKFSGSYRFRWPLRKGHTCADSA